jgi:4-amino-4-deoxy-L-arabinose transferase-like glycosyltransferase
MLLPIYAALSLCLCLPVSLSLYFSVSASFSSNMYAVALNPSCHIERLIEVHPLSLSISLSLSVFLHFTYTQVVSVSPCLPYSGRTVWNPYLKFPVYFIFVNQMWIENHKKQKYNLNVWFTSELNCRFKDLKSRLDFSDIKVFKKVKKLVFAENK